MSLLLYLTYSSLWKTWITFTAVAIFLALLIPLIAYFYTIKEKKEEILNINILISFIISSILLTLSFYSLNKNLPLNIENQITGYVALIGVMPTLYLWIVKERKKERELLNKGAELNQIRIAELNKVYVDAINQFNNPTSDSFLAGAYSLNGLIDDWINLYNENTENEHYYFTRVEQIAAILLSKIEERTTNKLFMVLSSSVVFKLSTFSKKNESLKITWKNFDLSYLDLKNICLEGEDLRGVLFIKSNLSRANFKRCTLIHANFEKSNLREATFEGTKLRGANFENSKLGHANFEKSRLLNTTFEKANLLEASFKYARLLQVNFKAAKLAETNFNHALISSPNFEYAKFISPLFSLDAIIDEGRISFSESLTISQIKSCAFLKHNKKYIIKDTLINKVQENYPDEETIILKDDFYRLVDKNYRL